MGEIMKVIFLDIDGVLNSMDWFERIKEQTGYNEINPSKVKLLKEIVDRTGADIVLSSTWKSLGSALPDGQTHPMYDYLKATLRKYGMKITSHTPYCEHDRPKEIKAWLDNYDDESSIRFVSLDDDFGREKYDIYGKWFGDCLVKTSFYEPDGGIRREHVELAVEILNR